MPGGLLGLEASHRTLPCPTIPYPMLPYSTLNASLSKSTWPEEVDVKSLAGSKSVALHPDDGRSERFVVHRVVMAITPGTNLSLSPSLPLFLSLSLSRPSCIKHASDMSGTDSKTNVTRGSWYIIRMRILICAFQLFVVLTKFVEQKRIY